MLERLKMPAAVNADWQRLHDIYVPLLRAWLVRLSAAPAGDDLAQEVWLVVLRKLPDFERGRDGSFRSWLRQIAVNQVRNWRRKERGPARPGPDDRAVAELEDPNSALTGQWDRDHDRYVFEKLLDVVRPDFTPATWAAFRRFALDGVPAVRVAEELHTTEAAVLQAKARVLKRLRAEAAGLIE